MPSQSATNASAEEYRHTAVRMLNNFLSTLPMISVKFLSDCLMGYLAESH